VHDGLRLALTTFTIVPLRAGAVDRRAAAVAMSLAPAVGALLGLALGGLLLGLGRLAPPLLAGVVVTAAAALLTRALHLDGLADTADALGSYRSGDAALSIMKRSDIGPFGVVTVVLVLLGQAAALGALAPRPWLAAMTSAATANAAGRLAVTWACRRGVPAARPDGLGALVAGTVPGPVAALATAAVVLIALPAVPGRPWQGPAAVLAALAVALLLLRHLVRRLGGITGDVLGAELELTTTVVYAGLLLG
jgi:adenosylcobinamide-GDP ribazoletransferase